jgi:hypothetical protein
LERFFNSIDSNAWIQTFGGIVGALLAGGIAIIIFKNQVKFDKNKDRIKELENFLKSNFIIKSWLKSASESVVEITNAIESQELEMDKRITILTHEINALKYCIEILDKLKDDYIPMDVYKEFIEVKTTLDLIGSQADIQLGIYQENLMLKFAPDFKLLSQKVMEYAELFERYGLEREQELKMLK